MTHGICPLCKNVTTINAVEYINKLSGHVMQTTEHCHACIYTKIDTEKIGVRGQMLNTQ